MWSGDTGGQGWGINPEWGGMRLYDVMRRARPDFFVNSGDLVYADTPLKPEVDIPGGGTWKNVVTPAKSKVAETLEEFRGNHRYNLTDEHVRRFNAEVPLYVQWDDHDVVDNWYPGAPRRRPLRGEERGAAGGPRETGDARVHAPHGLPAGAGARLPPDQPGSPPGPLYARHAELPRPERRQPTDVADRRGPYSGARASCRG